MGRRKGIARDKISGYIFTARSFRHQAFYAIKRRKRDAAFKVLTLVILAHRHFTETATGTRAGCGTAIREIKSRT